MDGGAQPSGNNLILELLKGLIAQNDSKTLKPYLAQGGEEMGEAPSGEQMMPELSEEEMAELDEQEM